MPWLWLVALLAIGSAVVAARTLGRPTTEATRPTEPALTVRSLPTNTPVPSGRVEPAAAPLATATALRPRATPTAVATARPASTEATTMVSRTGSATATLRTTAPSGTPTTEAIAAPTVPHGAAASVALTFDAGADRGYAQDILDILQEQHVAASFGITGLWAKANPDLVRRMAADGHLVFNHTYDHRSFTGLSDSFGGLSPASRRTELEEADAIIAPLIGHSTQPFYRLPYGDDDARVAADVLPAGYTRKISWTVDSLGWKGLQTGDILARCVKLAAPGAVYVFHVGRASQDAMALPQLIHALRDKGFGFRRVDET